MNRILIIEDDPVLGPGLRDFLKKNFSPFYLIMAMILKKKILQNSI